MNLQKIRRLDLLLSSLLVLCLGRLWLLVLPSSFWIDEFVTAFAIQFPAHPSFSIAPQVPQSIYYWLPRVAGSLFGFSEWSYRLPSVLAAACTLFIVFRLAARLIHPSAGWFSVFACLALDPFNYHATDARPYGFGLAVASASILCLIRWLDSAAWRDAVAFTAFAALLLNIHLIYWPFYLVLACYACLRLFWRETAASFLQILFAVVTVSAGIAPALLNAVGLSANAASHVISAMPGLQDLPPVLNWLLIPKCCLLAWLVSRVLAMRRSPESPTTESRNSNTSTSVLLATWWLLPPICVFLYSLVTGISLFVPRYMSLLLPGLALCATAVAARLVRPMFWKPSAVALALFVLVSRGHWGDPAPRHDISDWKAGAAAERRLARSADTPVICPSPFVEAVPPAWSPDYSRPGFLYVHLLYYPVLGVPYLFPVADAPEAREYIARLIPETLTPSGRFLVYGQGPQVDYWVRILQSYPQLKTWQFRTQRFGGVAVTEVTPGHE